MLFRSRKKQRFCAVTVLLALCFKVALAAPLSCCLDMAQMPDDCHGPETTMHAGHHATHVSGESDDVGMSAACTLCQCVINAADNALTPQSVPVLQLSVAVMNTAVQVEWGDARIVALYLSRGPPPVSLV